MVSAKMARQLKCLSLLLQIQTHLAAEKLHEKQSFDFQLTYGRQ